MTQEMSADRRMRNAARPKSATADITHSIIVCLVCEKVIDGAKGRAYLQLIAAVARRQRVGNICCRIRVLHGFNFDRI
jgi:hypothetical protein